MGRRRWAYRVLAALVLADLVGAGLTIADRGSGVQPGSGRAQGSAAADAAARALDRTQRDIAVSDLLALRARAVLTHNATEFLATVDPAEPGFYAHELQVFRNRSAVPFASWSYVLDPQEELPAAGLPARYGAPVWVPQVQLAYELAGFDAQPAVGSETYTFVDRPQGWRIASDSDFSYAPSDQELWDFGPVTVVRRGRALVLGHPGELPLEQAVAAEVVRDIPAVSAVWGT
ncbi:MAG: hypothetical protein ACYDB7_08395, partial [Mycobacteriales bacterium]